MAQGTGGIAKNTYHVSAAEEPKYKVGRNDSAHALKCFELTGFSRVCPHESGALTRIAPALHRIDPPPPFGLLL